MSILSNEIPDKCPGNCPKGPDFDTDLVCYDCPVLLVLRVLWQPPTKWHPTKKEWSIRRKSD